MGAAAAVAAAITCTVTTAPRSGLPFCCRTRTCRSVAQAALHRLKHSSRPANRRANPGHLPRTLPFALCIGLAHPCEFSLLLPTARLERYDWGYHLSRSGELKSWTVSATAFSH